MIDNAINVESPLGVELTLYPAGLPVRTMAYLIDFGIKLIFYIAIDTISEFIGGLGIGVSLIIIFVTEWFYFVLWDTLNNGKPPGKIFMGLRTVHADGSPITLSGSVIRSFLLVVDIFPYFPFIGPISMAASRNYSRVGDLAASTMVVYDADSTIREPQRVQVRKSLPMPLSQDERQNFLAFQNRFEEFSKERQIELSETLKPLLNESGARASFEALGVAENIRRSA